MEAILARHPARSTEWLDCHSKSCELWRIRTGPIAALSFRAEHMRRHLEESFGDKVLVTAHEHERKGCLYTATRALATLWVPGSSQVLVIVFKKEWSHCQTKYHSTQLKTRTFTMPQLYLFGVSCWQYKIEWRGLQHWTQSAKTLPQYGSCSFLCV